MSGRFWWHMAALAAGASTLTPCWATPTVTLSLCSSQDGLVVQPGDTIDWQISFTVSQGDNLGLALLAVDFVQSATNPDGCCLERGSVVPQEMEQFSCPMGVSNPGEHGYWTGYVGSRRDAIGGADLHQIGGAQNTFGESGQVQGWSTEVLTAVGQGESAQRLTEGAFEAPETRGTYNLDLTEAVANVLDQYDEQNERWCISEATVQYDPGYIAFIVCPGDATGDASVTLSDLAKVLSAIGSCVGDANYDPDADLDRSGCIDQTDEQIVKDNYYTVCE